MSIHQNTANNFNDLRSSERCGARTAFQEAQAEQRCLPFVELNREIEDLSGMPMNEVPALCGQEGYRRFEAQAIGRVIAMDDSMILAIAGGIVAIRAYRPAP